MNLGQFIMMKRKEQGLTQEELAKIIGKHKSFVCKLEKNHVRSLKDDMIVPLANALSIPITDLFDGWNADGTKRFERITAQEFEQEIYSLLSRNAHIHFDYSSWLYLSKKLLNNVVDLDENQKKQIASYLELFKQ